MQWAWRDRNDRKARGYYGVPRLSPDGKRLAIVIEERNRGDIWIHDIGRDTLSRLTTEGESLAPAWSPDGQWVAFSSDRAGNNDLYRKPSDFSGPAEVILTKEHDQYPRTWSPDSTLLTYAEFRPIEGWDLWVA